MTETLLLTGTIKPNPNIKKTSYGYGHSIDVNERIKDYYFAISYYIIYSDFNNIIFIENSNYDCKSTFSILKDLSKLYSKNLEIIQFKGNDDMVLEKGYGWGEGEIINYAIKNSNILKSAKNWYKITGRYIIENINQIINETKNFDNLFIRHLFGWGFFCVNTAFFKTNNDTYIKYLQPINSELKSTAPIELMYYKKLRKANISFGKLRAIPKRIDRNYKDWNYCYIHRIFLNLGLWNMENKIGNFLDCTLYEHFILKHI